MAVTKTQQIKGTPSHECRHSKHLKKKPNNNTGSVPAALLTLDPTQTAALVFPVGKGVALLTGDNDEEMSQGSMTNVDLTGDHGALNKVDDKSKNNNMAKDGLNLDTETVLKRSSHLGDNSNTNPTQALVSPLEKVVTYLTGNYAKKAW